MRIKHKGLRSYWLKGKPAGLSQSYIGTINEILTVLESATSVRDTQILTGWHALKGNRGGTFAVTASRNWRITFIWRDGEAVDIDYED